MINKSEGKNLTLCLCFFWFDFFLRQFGKSFKHIFNGPYRNFATKPVFLMILQVVISAWPEQNKLIFLESVLYDQMKGGCQPKTKN